MKPPITLTMNGVTPHRSASAPADQPAPETAEHLDDHRPCSEHSEAKRRAGQCCGRCQRAMQQRLAS